MIFLSIILWKKQNIENVKKTMAKLLKMCNERKR